MYNSRIGRRTRRISDSKLADKDIRRKRFIDEDDIEDEDDDDLGEMKLTNEEVQGLMELLPYKDALIKIAKGEFEIEKVEEEEAPAEEQPAEEEAGADADADADNFEEDEDFDEPADDEADDDFDLEEEEDEDEAVVEDSDLNEVWTKRLAGNK